MLRRAGSTRRTLLEVASVRTCRSSGVAIRMAGNSGKDALKSTSRPQARAWGPPAIFGRLHSTSSEQGDRHAAGLHQPHQRDAEPPTVIPVPSSDDLFIDLFIDLFTILVVNGCSSSRRVASVIQ